MDNLLSFSIKKCVVLHFKVNSSMTTNYFINGVELTNITKFGIIFSNNLSWADHIEAIVAKAYKSLGLLRRTFKHTLAKRTLYLMLVRSKLLYCSPLWWPYLIKEIVLLKRVQRRAAKFILNNYTIQTTKQDWLSKDPHWQFNVYNHIHFNDSHTRSSSSKLCHKYFDNVVSANSYFCRIPRLWNVLPIIDLTLSFTTIKCKLYTFLWNYF